MQLRILSLIVLILSGPTLMGQDTTCEQLDLGKVEFKKNSAKLTAAAKAKLDSLIIFINRQTSCGILVTSSAADLCDKCGALSWDRQAAVITYLVKKGVSENRLLTFTRLEGSLDLIALTFTSLPLTDSMSPHPALLRGRRRPVAN